MTSKLRPAFARLVVAATSVLAMVVAPRAARAETEVERAARLFKEGRAAMTAGDAAIACPKFAEAQRLDPAPGTLLNLGLCMEQVGKLGTALAHLNAVRAQISPADARAKLVADKIDQIAPNVPRLRLSLAAGAPEDTTVDRDAQGPIPFGRLGGQLLLDAGEHTLVVAAPSRAQRRYTVTLEAGAVQSLTVEPGDPAVTVPFVEPPPARPRGFTTAGKAGLALVGVGGALLVVGAITGALAIGDKSTVQTSCHGTSVCDSPSGVDAASQGRTVSAVSTVGFVGGLAIAGVGVGLAIAGRPTSPHAAATTWVLSPGGVACVTRF